MNSKRKFFYIFCFIVFDIFLLIAFLVVRDATSYDRLANEILVLKTLDIRKDRYNTKIKSSGDYALVEKVIKEYMDDCAVDIQKISSMVNDKKLKSILSYDNYMSDGPDFKDSLKYLNSQSDEFNKLVDELSKKLEDDYIKKFISKKIDDDYYISLCEELIFDDDFVKSRNSIKSLLIEEKDNMNNIYDVSLNVLSYLSLCQDDWKLEDGEIKFKTQEKYSYYTSLVDKLKKTE